MPNRSTRARGLGVVLGFLGVVVLVGAAGRRRAAVVADRDRAGGGGVVRVRVAWQAPMMRIAGAGVKTPASSAAVALLPLPFPATTASCPIRRWCRRCLRWRFRPLAGVPDLFPVDPRGRTDTAPYRRLPTILVFCHPVGRPLLSARLFTLNMLLGGALILLGSLANHRGFAGLWARQSVRRLDHEASYIVRNYGPAWDNSFVIQNDNHYHYCHESASTEGPWDQDHHLCRQHARYRVHGGVPATDIVIGGIGADRTGSQQHRGLLFHGASAASRPPAAAGARRSRAGGGVNRLPATE